MVERIKSFISGTAKYMAVVLTIVTTGFAIIYAVWGFMEKREDREDKRQERRQQEMKEWVVAALHDIVLTKDEFREYTEKQDALQAHNLRLLREMALATDSTLVVVLPSVTERQREIYNRLMALESVILERDELTESEKVWQYLRQKEINDSTARRHDEVMLYLKRILDERTRPKFGDRIE